MEEIFLQLQINNPIRTMLQHFPSTLVANTQDEILEDDDTITCSGLNRVTDTRRKWIVPFGSTSQQLTYCNACAKKYNITGNPYKCNSSCNCDSYSISNKFNNGVFNISFWRPDMNSHYPTTEDSLSVASGDQFYILLCGNLKKKQSFRYAINLNDKNGKFIKQLYNNLIYCKKTIIPRDENNNKILFTFINDNIPVVRKALCQTDSIVILSGQYLEFCIDIYELKARDFSATSNHQFGHFITNKNNRVTCKIPGQSSDRITEDYGEKPRIVLPSCQFVKFTENPMKMSINFTEIQDDNKAIYRVIKAYKTSIDSYEQSLLSTKKRITEKISDTLLLATDVQHRLEEHRTFMSELVDFLPSENLQEPPNTSVSPDDPNIFSCMEDVD